MRETTKERYRGGGELEQVREKVENEGGEEREAELKRTDGDRQQGVGCGNLVLIVAKALLHLTKSSIRSVLTA